MELRMTTDLETALPAEIGFNFDELEAELTERLNHYNNLVVTEDAIKDAKTDLANLRKLRDAIETRRKEVKRQCMAPYNAFEARVKKLTAMIDAPVAAINGQVKAFEEQEKENKRREIEAVYEELVPEAYKEIIPLARILDPKWLNKSTTMKSIQEEIATRMQRVKVDMTLLDMVDPKYTAAVRAKYIETLDVSIAMEHRDTLEAADMAFQQREAERSAFRTPVQEKPPVAIQEPAPQPKADEKLYALRLEFQITMSQANALKRFLAESEIQYTKI